MDFFREVRFGFGRGQFETPLHVGLQESLLVHGLVEDFFRDAEDRLGEYGPGLVDDERDAGVESPVLQGIAVDDAQVLQGNAQEFLEAAADPLGELNVLLVFQQVEDQPRREAGELLPVGLVHFLVQAFYFFQEFGEVEFLLFAAFLLQRSHILVGFGSSLDQAGEQAEERVLAEKVGAQGGGQHGGGHEHAAGSLKEEIDDIESGPRPQVQNEKIAIKRLQFLQQFAFLGHGQVGEARDLGVAGHQAHARVGGGQDDVSDGAVEGLDEGAHALFYPADAQHEMQIGGPQVQIGADHRFPGLPQGHGQVGGQEGFSHSAFSARYRDNLHAYFSPSSGRYLISKNSSRGFTYFLLTLQLR